MPKSYDCLILGSGIGGTVSALVLAQMGMQVLVVESGKHPRFAIGESTVPGTTVGFNYLAKTYGIPELRQISHYPELKALGLASWPKLGFWFGLHQDGQSPQPGDELMFIPPSLPIGPDVHIFRSDVDHFLVSCLNGYGVDYLDQTTIAEHEIQESGVKLVLNTNNKLSSIDTRFILDSSGYKSFLASEFGLRNHEPGLHTNSRAIFSHFRDVALLEDVFDRPGKPFHIKRDAGTIHHCFEGGWFWIIRFDNDITSVGVVLDRDIYPDNNQSAEDEFRSFVSRFPTVEAQLRSAYAIRPLIKTGRIQYTSRTILGDRYLLTPHAASFIDPLFSPGLNVTVGFITRMAPILQRMMNDDNFCAERLKPLQQSYMAEVKCLDQLIHGMYLSFRHSDIFKQYWRCWIFASVAQYYMQNAYTPHDSNELPSLYGASLPSWSAKLDQIYQYVSDKTLEPKQVALLVKSAMDSFVQPCDEKLTNWDIDSKDPCCPVFVNGHPGTEWMQWFVHEEPLLQKPANERWLSELQQRLHLANSELKIRYQESKIERTAYHKGVDFIRVQVNGSNQFSTSPG